MELDLRMLITGALWGMLKLISNMKDFMEVLRGVGFRVWLSIQAGLRI